MIGAVFLDRDGVIIEDRTDYVKSWSEVTYIPTAFEAIRRFASAGLPVVVITNQAAVGRGIVTADFVDSVHERLIKDIAEHGGAVSAVYFCPHHPDGGCDCRKPLPGMLLRAASELNIDLKSSVIVGDAKRDLQAGAAVGTAGILVRTGKGRSEEIALTSSGELNTLCISVVDDIGASADYILNVMKLGRTGAENATPPELCEKA